MSGRILFPETLSSSRIQTFLRCSTIVAKRWIMIVLIVNQRRFLHLFFFIFRYFVNASHHFITIALDKLSILNFKLLWIVIHAHLLHGGGVFLTILNGSAFNVWVRLIGV